MMAETMDEIANLATILRENGDKVLNGASKLSINATLLHEISSRLREITIGERDNDPFEVLSPIHGLSRTADHLQLLHDFFQKTEGLKVENSSNHLNPGYKIDLSKFKKLKYLELKRVPVKQIIGLKPVQHQIECIVCERGMTSLEHLLAECGGDNSTGFVWSELKEAVLSFNDIKIVDSSVAFAPRLQVLDLSHNQIFDVKAIERLPNLKYVNLSYNSLTVIPMFNNSARKQIQVLVLKNNYIEDLTPLFGLDCLTELDISHNLICGVKSFGLFLSMSTLRCLTMVGNPVCTVPSYRLAVVRNLHISASFGKFVLDGTCLTKRERENVGLELVKSPSTDSNATQVLIDESSIVSTAPETERPKKKSGKVRVAIIPNLDGTYEGLSPDLHNVNLSAPSSDYLLTKERIRRARETHKDNWLRCDPQEILGIPDVSLSSTPYDDACLDAILKDVNPITDDNVITTVAVIEPVPAHLKDEEGDSTFLTCDDDENNLAYFSVNEGDNKETSPDIETIDDSDEEDEDKKGTIYLVIRLFYEGSEIRREDVFLTVTETDLREQDVTDGRTLCCWSLETLQSVILVREREVHLVFDTIRRDRRERFYELETHEAAKFHKICRTVLEGKSLTEMKQTPYRCVSCSVAFVVEKIKRVREADIECPVCGSKLVILNDEAKKEEEVVIQSPVKNKSLHNRSASVGVAPNITKEVSKCFSHPDIDAATMMNENYANSTTPSAFYASGKRCDSDIEIISNPSESSIEVIEGPNKQTENEDQLPDEKLLMPHTGAVAAFTGLTESSSSGSITDSICTAYENSSMVSSGVSKKSGLETSALIEEPTEDFSYPAKDSEKVHPDRKSYVDKDIDLVKYSFTDFSDLDHRLKLYVYAHLFDDNWEECVFLLRCQILSSNDNTSFDACVVCSNLKFYVLKITGPENGEEASKFLQKADNFRYNVGVLKSWQVLSWHQGLSVSFQTSKEKTVDFLILLKEKNRTQTFFDFVKKLGNIFPKCDWIKTPAPFASLRVSQSLVANAEDTNILTVVGFIECQINKDTALSDGAVLVTPTDLFIVDSLKWIANKPDLDAPVPVNCQKLCDLIEANIFDQELNLLFINESEEKQHTWNLSLASEAVVNHLLNQLRTPWEVLFSVPLPVNQNDHF